MQLSPRWHAPRQGRFDIHVHVLQLRLPLELPPLDGFPDGVQPLDNRPQLSLSQQTHLP